MKDETRKTGLVTVIVPAAILLLFFLFSLVMAFLSPGKKSEDLIRSSSLQEKTWEEGSVSFTEYRDAEGNPAFAADLGYAVKKTTTEKENVTLAEFFDAEGNPSKQGEGHYAYRREHLVGENADRYTYLDLEHQPMTLKSGYARRVVYYNDLGKPDSVRYYDLQDQPVVTAYYGFTQYWEYDPLGQATVIRYTDTEGKPMITRSGYATAHRTFYPEGPDAGRVDREFYYDEEERPMALANGAYGVHREYDAFGRIEWIVYLDQRGEPFINTDGYSAIKRTYYGDDSVRTEMYYDTNRKQVALLEGQYGILKENGNVVYLDADGGPVFNLRTFLYNSQLTVMAAAVIAALLSLSFGRRINLILLWLYFLAIAYMTLFLRSGGESRIEWEIFWAYKQFFRDPVLRKEILDNIWLFVPLGTILYRLWPRKLTLLMPVVLSAAIEAVQYFRGTGLAEFDDLFSNSLGGVLGFSLGYVVYSICRRLSNKK